MRHAATLIAVLALAALLAGSPSSAATTPQLRVVSIGDSFIAGNGAGNYYPGQGPGQPDAGGPRVPAPGRNCYQSYSSYPWQYVQKLNDNGHPAAIWHAACGGAWTYDLASQWNTVPADWRSQADIVLVSAGGNDAGFGDVVAHCLMSLPGSPTCDDSLAKAGAAMPGALDRLKAAVLQLAPQAPRARFVLVGYPLLASPQKQRCTSRGEAQLNLIQARHDAALIVLARDVNSQLGAQRVQAAPVASRFADRGPCALASSLLNDWTAPDGERFHPNWAGAHEYAEVLYDLQLLPAGS